MLKVFLVIYFTTFIHFSTCEELIFVSLHSRHGARAPLNCDDNRIDYLGEEWTNPGELTPTGQRMEYILGLRNRQRYITEKKFISDSFDPHEILVFSTNVNRTILSMASQLQGLYPMSSKSGLQLTEKQLDVSYPPINYSYVEILDAIDNLNSSALPNYMTIIPIHTTKSSERKMNVPDSTNCKEKVNKTRDYNKEHNQKVIDAAKDFNDKYSKNLGKYYDKNGDNFTYDFDWIGLFCDTMISDDSDGRTMDDFINRTGIDRDELLKDCRDIVYINFKEDFYGDENNDVILLSESKLIKEVLYYMQLKIDEDMNKKEGEESKPVNVSDYSKPKMVIYSGHDSTLTAEELFMLKFFKTNKDYIYPTYTSQLAFEVTRDAKKDDYSSYKVKFYFNDVLYVETNFKEFKKIIEENAWTDEKVSEFCNDPKKEEYNNSKDKDDDDDDNNSLQLYAIIGLSALALIFIIIIICLAMKIKNMNAKKRKFSDDFDKKDGLLNEDEA